MNHTPYPRIEVYSEIDKGDPNAGNNTWTDPSGDTVYGGKADYRPHILRKTYLIKEDQKAKLLQTPLAWLPYFNIQKEAITLDQYFQAATNTDRYPFYNMLPQNLNGLFTQKNKDKDYPYYNTLLVYEASYPQEFTVVWLDEQTWFLDNVYYTSNSGLLEFMEAAEEDLVIEGAFKDFLRLSPIFQYKLTEGFPSIKLQATEKTIPLDEIVLRISLSPGMPNTHSYNIQIAGDGSIMRHGFKSRDKIDPNKLTAILLEAQRLNWNRYEINDLSKMAKPFVHDAQVFSLSVWENGRFHSVDDPDLSLDGSLSAFVKMVKEVPKIKSIIEGFLF